MHAEDHPKVPPPLQACQPKQPAQPQPSPLAPRLIPNRNHAHPASGPAHQPDRTTRLHGHRYHRPTSSRPVPTPAATSAPGPVHRTTSHRVPAHCAPLLNLRQAAHPTYARNHPEAQALPPITRQVPTGQARKAPPAAPLAAHTPEVLAREAAAEAAPTAAAAAEAATAAEAHPAAAAEVLTPADPPPADPPLRVCHPAARAAVHAPVDPPHLPQVDDKQYEKNSNTGLKNSSTGSCYINATNRFYKIP